MHALTHTHTHTHTHAHTQTQTHMHSHIVTNASTLSDPHTNTLLYTHTHTHTHTHTKVGRTHTHTHTHTQTHTHTHMHTHVPSKHTHIRKCSHMHTHRYVYRDLHTKKKTAIFFKSVHHLLTQCIIISTDTNAHTHTQKKKHKTNMHKYTPDNTRWHHYWVMTTPVHHGPTFKTTTYTSSHRQHKYILTGWSYSLYYTELNCYPDTLAKLFWGLIKGDLFVSAYSSSESWTARTIYPGIDTE